MTVEITVRGAVQGIGYRPFVAGLAEQLHMKGSVRNSGGIVRIVVTDTRERISLFEERLRREVPAGGLVVSVDERILQDKTEPGPYTDEIEPDAGTDETVRGAGADGFYIIESSAERSSELPAFPPDIGICKECMKEMQDPRNRRYRYGLTSCASCGPRWSILERFPYDRPNTTMKRFPMCRECAGEYQKGRRRHAQTISCHSCGPQMYLLINTDRKGDHAKGTDRKEDCVKGTDLKEDRVKSTCCKEDQTQGDAWITECGTQAKDTVQTGNPQFRKTETIQGEEIQGRYEGDEGFSLAVSILKSGGILALKGVGGYQLLCSPYREDSVRRLRSMKGREEKPFAVMFPDTDAIRQMAEVSEKEQELLESAARPIVLLVRRQGEQEQKREKDGTEPGMQERDRRPDFASNVSGESRYLGAFLPSVGIQKLLLDETGPLIVTSANLSGEPIPTDDDGFRGMVFAGGGRPDGIYTHDRKILRPLDDSVLAVVCGHVQFIRRSRGYVPMPVFLTETGTYRADDADHTDGSDAIATTDSTTGDNIILAAGGDLKAAFAIGKGERVILSQYIGDLADYAVMSNYRKLIPDMMQVFLPVGGKDAGNAEGGQVGLVVCDMHPGYFSTQFAKRYAEEHKVPCLQVQHHQAHAASVMAEHGLTSCIGIVFDGTGAGTDGQLWGGEFLYLRGTSFKRLGSLSPIKLQGGDAVSIHADLAADCFLFASGRDDLLSNQLTAKLLNQNINTVLSTSMGRLFDAVSAMLGICHENAYEGECAILLENAAWRGWQKECLSETSVKIHAEGVERVLAGLRKYFDRLTAVNEDGRMLLDCDQVIRGLLAMRDNGAPVERMALAFHLEIADGAVRIAQMLSEQTGERHICLSGGTFANRLLLSSMEALLAERGLSVYVNEQVPCNDGGISLGQVYLGLMRQSAGAETVP